MLFLQCAEDIFIRKQAGSMLQEQTQKDEHTIRDAEGARKATGERRTKSKKRAGMSGKHEGTTRQSGRCLLELEMTS
jgi:hypothetical protein